MVITYVESHASGNIESVSIFQLSIHNTGSGLISNNTPSIEQTTAGPIFNIFYRDHIFLLNLYCNKKKNGVLNNGRQKKKIDNNCSMMNEGIRPKYLEPVAHRKV